LQRIKKDTQECPPMFQNLKFLKIFRKYCSKTPFSPWKSSFRVEDQLQMPIQQFMWIHWQISQKLGTYSAQIQAKMPPQMNFKFLRLLLFFKWKMKNEVFGKNSKLEKSTYMTCVHLDYVGIYNSISKTSKRCQFLKL